MAPCQGQLRGAMVVESQRGDGHPLFITKPNNPQKNWSGLVWPNGWGMDGMVRGQEGRGSGASEWQFFFSFFFFLTEVLVGFLRGAKGGW